MSFQNIKIIYHYFLHSNKIFIYKHLTNHFACCYQSFLWRPILHINGLNWPHYHPGEHPLGQVRLHGRGIQINTEIALLSGRPTASLPQNTTPLATPPVIQPPTYQTSIDNVCDMGTCRVRGCCCGTWIYGRRALSHDVVNDNAAPKCPGCQ